MSEFFSWDDELDTDVDEYPILMPGTYPYEVKKVETGTWDKPGKMDGCPYAELTLLIDDKVQTTERLWLKEDLKFKIAEFLTSVSMKEKAKESHIPKSSIRKDVPVCVRLNVRPARKKATVCSKKMK